MLAGRGRSSASMYPRSKGGGLLGNVTGLSFTKPRRRNVDHDDGEESDTSSQNSPTASSNEDSLITPPSNLPDGFQSLPSPVEGDGRPPTPWGDKCTAKKNIVEALKDDTHDIHLYIGDYDEKDFKDVNFNKLHEHYASRYPRSRFRQNLKNILIHKLKCSGPFRVNLAESGVKEWKSQSGRSRGWNLLFALLMDRKTRSEVLSMSLDNLWSSNEYFNCYPKDDFQIYLKEMIDVTGKARAKIESEEELFLEDMKNFPPSELNNRGEKFWYNHPARKLLEADVRNGWAYDMKPSILRLTRIEYQDFTPYTFLKHVHQEKERQRAAPYWRHKRNIAASQKIADERAEMKQQWEVDRLGDKLGQLGKLH